MTTLMILRIVHIVFGIYIAGSYLFLVPILEPRLKRLGPTIQSPVMRALMPILTPINAISFIIIIGTGLAMTLIMRSGALNTLFVTTWGWAMIIGLGDTSCLCRGFRLPNDHGVPHGQIGPQHRGARSHPG